MPKTDALVAGILESLTDLHLKGGAAAFRKALSKIRRNRFSSSNAASLDVAVRREVEEGLLTLDDRDIVDTLTHLESFKATNAVKTRQKARTFAAGPHGHAISTICGND